MPHWPRRGLLSCLLFALPLRSRPFLMKRSIVDHFFSSAKKRTPSDLPPAAPATVPPESSKNDSEEHVFSIEWEPLAGLSPSWRGIVHSESEQPYFRDLIAFVKAEQAKHTVYPPPKEIFSAFNLCPLDSVRVVVIGQDPYHGPNQAHGLAFSVKAGVNLPPSLRNIFTELRSDLGISPPRGGNLEKWSRQGVMLLNTVLTVRKGEAFSHQKRGWEQFTDAVIRKLAAGDRRLVFLLWGKPAQSKVATCGIDLARHVVITSSHPSPLAASKTNEPFLGSKYGPPLPHSLPENPLDASPGAIVPSLRYGGQTIRPSTGRYNPVDKIQTVCLLQSLGGLGNLFDLAWCVPCYILYTRCRY